MGEIQETSGRIANDSLGQLACDLNFYSERMSTANSFKIDKHFHL